jgi:hypothetical protein
MHNSGKFASALSGFAAILLVSSSAFASDLNGKGSTKDVFGNTVSAEQSWTGLWAAALGSYSMSNTELSLDHFRDRDGDVTKRNLGKVDGLGGEGFGGRAQIGFDKQFGSFVAGVWGGASISNSESTLSDGDDTYTIEEKESYEAAIRAGILLGKASHTLLYVAGGHTWTNAEVSGPEGLSEEFDLEGWFGEIGVESRIADNTYLRGAGRYTAYDDFTAAKWGNDNCWNEINADPGKLEFMAGVVFKFGNVPGLN